MGTTYPPDGWSVEHGTWGTDMDQETSVVQVGLYSVKYISTATALASLVSDYRPVLPSYPYWLQSNLRADNVTAKNMGFGCHWYTAAKAYISSSTVLSTSLPAINTWYDITDVVESPATAAFARVYVGRFTASFNGYSSLASIAEAPPMFSAYKNASSQNVSNGDTIEFDAENYDYGSNYSTANDQFTAPSDGVYTFGAQARFNDVDDNEYVFLGLKVAGTITRVSTSPYSTGANNPVFVSGAWSVYLSRGDTVEITGHHNHGGTLVVPNITGSLQYAQFYGFRVE